jgi:hypothetical protein
MLNEAIDNEPLCVRASLVRIVITKIKMLPFASTNVRIYNLL